MSCSPPTIFHHHRFTITSCVNRDTQYGFRGDSRQALLRYAEDLDERRRQQRMQITLNHPAFQRAKENASEVVMLQHLVAEAARHDFALLSEVTTTQQKRREDQQQRSAQDVVDADLVRQTSHDMISNSSTTSVGDAHHSEDDDNKASPQQQLDAHTMVKRAHRLYWDAVMRDTLDTFHRCCSYGNNSATAYANATEQLARRLIWRRPVSALVAGSTAASSIAPTDDQCWEVLDYERSIVKEPSLLQQQLHHSQLLLLQQLREAGMLFTSS